MIKPLFKTENGETIITKHINIIFKEKELGEKCNAQKMHIANSPLSSDVMNCWIDNIQ